MKKKIIKLIPYIIGGLVIIVGLVLAIIPLFSFNRFTFDIAHAMVFGLLFPIIGVGIIMTTWIISINSESKKDEIQTNQEN